MAKVKPFHGLLYNTAKVNPKDVTAPPYDIISPEYQSELYNRSPYNVIRLEYGKEESGDNDKSNKYTRAGEYLNTFLNEGVLEVDPEEAFYLYELVFRPEGGSTEKKLRGLVCAVGLEEFSTGVILPHEETLSKAKTDRLNLMCATNCNFSQIYSLYHDKEGVIRSLVQEAAKNPPHVSFTSDEGVLQNMWRITDGAVQEAISRAFSDKQLFIADGHHRYETALNYNKSYPTPGSDYVMMFLTDMEDDGLMVFPTHRMLSNLESFDEQAAIAEISKYFSVEKITGIEDIDKKISDVDSATFGFYTGGDYFYRLTLKEPSPMASFLPNKSEALRNLDVSILHSLILNRVFGIDTENMANQKNLTYTKLLNEAISEVQNGHQQCSFILNATRVSEIRDISLSHEKMPQKSTYFWPKLITGLIMRKIN